MTWLEGATLGVIVEGQGEVDAAQVLIRRITLALDLRAAVRCKVCRVSKSQLLQDGELERTVAGWSSTSLPGRRW
jgi:hypothetical protein